MLVVVLGGGCAVAFAVVLWMIIARRNALARSDVDVQSCLSNLGRLRAVYATGLMDAPPRRDLDELTRRAAQRLHAPIALMSLLDDRRQFFASQFGLGDGNAPREAPLDHSFCKYVVAGDKPFVVEDAQLHPLVRESVATTELGVRSYLGVPLRSDDGHVLGSFCVVDLEPRDWAAEERRELEELAGAAMAVAVSH